MADVFAVISKAVFEKAARGLGVGDVHAITSYDSNPAAFAALDGGNLYVVTARPGDVLWLVAVLHQPKLKGGKWIAAANTTPITDISSLIKKLKFASGNGIHAKAGQLGMSLQTPRALADEDVTAMSSLLGSKSKTSTKNSTQDALVLADAMLDKGDPRGELVQLQNALKAKPNDKKLRTAEAKLLKTHAATLLGPLAKWQKKLTWKLGFIDEAELHSPRGDEVANALAHPSMQRVTKLVLDLEYEHGPSAIIGLGKTKLPTLRTLSIIHRVMEDEDHAEGYALDACEHEKPSNAAWAAVPNVETLHLKGWGLCHGIVLPNLKSLHIEGYPCCDQKLKIPNVESIKVELEYDDTGTGVDFGTETISNTWLSKTPKLRSLDLKNCSAVGFEEAQEDGAEDADDPLEHVLHNDTAFRKVAPQLDYLAFPGSTLKTNAAIKKWLA